MEGIMKIIERSKDIVIMLEYTNFYNNMPKEEFDRRSLKLLKWLQAQKMVFYMMKRFRDSCKDTIFY